MIRITLLLFLLQSFIVRSQLVDLVTTLNVPLIETSGLIHLNDRWITHLDSGGGSMLFEIDSVTGNVSRTVTVLQATNVDWEAMCHDDTYIYIGDIGNNAGTRMNLGVYRITQAEYFSTPNDTVNAEFISFSYEDQVDFSSAVFSTNFDAEAMLALNDSLYIFTKNWGNSYTNIYTIPVIPGTYSANRIDSLLVGGLVTGATINSTQDTLTFVGYFIQNSFLAQLTGFSLTNFSSGNLVSSNLSLQESYQTESIAIDNGKFFITSEAHSSGSPAMYRVQLGNSLGVNQVAVNTVFVFPNPVTKELHFSEDFSAIEITNAHGKLVLKSRDAGQVVSVEHLPSGIYMVKCHIGNGNKVSAHRMVIQ